MPQITGTVSTSGDNTLIAAPGPGRQIFITGWALTATATTTNVFFKDNGGQIYSEPHSVSTVGKQHGSQAGPAVGVTSSSGSLLSGTALNVNTAVVINLSASNSINYTIDYYIK